MEKKQRVIAFYRDHPSLKLIIEQAEQSRLMFEQRRGFIKKQLADLRKEEETDGEAITRAIVSECEHLQLLEKDELKARGEHLHYDVDTMTVQRCGGGHGLNSMFGFLS